MKRTEMRVIARNEAQEPVHYQVEVGPFTLEVFRRLPGWYWAVYLGEPHLNVVWVGDFKEPVSTAQQAVMAGTIALGNKLHVLKAQVGEICLPSSSPTGKTASGRALPCPRCGGVIECTCTWTRLTT